MGFDLMHIATIINRMRKSAAYPLLIGIVLLAVSQAARAKEMSVNEFISHCERIKVILFKMQVSNRSGKEFNSELSSKLEKFDSSFRIQDGSGNLVEFNWEREVDALKSAVKSEKQDQPDVLPRLSQLLSRIQDDLDMAKKMAGNRGFVDRSNIDKAARDTLPGEGSGYTVVQPGSEIKGLSREKSKETMSLLKRILDFLQRINRWISERTGGGIRIPAFKGVSGINWIVALLVIAILALFFINMIPLMRFGRKLKAAATEGDEDYISISLSQAIEAAEKHAKAGNYISALKELLRGFFMGLDEKGLIPYRMSRTNREYRYAIPRHAPEYATLAREFLPFMDDVLYGGRSTAGDSYLKYKRELEEVFKKIGN